MLKTERRRRKFFETTGLRRHIEQSTNGIQTSEQEKFWLPKSNLLTNFSQKSRHQDELFDTVLVKKRSSYAKALAGRASAFPNSDKVITTRTRACNERDFEYKARVLVALAKTGTMREVSANVPTCEAP